MSVRSATDAPLPTVILTLDDLIATRLKLTRAQSNPIGNSPWQGRFAARQRGQGMEFDDLRPYQAGDDVRRIDWKVSARLGSMHTRLYREEKDYAATWLLDLRDSMFTGSQQLRAVTAGLLVAHRLWQTAELGNRIAVAIIDRDGLHCSERNAGEQGALAGCALIAERMSVVAASLDRSRRSEYTTTRTPSSINTLVDYASREGRRLGQIEWVTGLDDLHVQNPSAVTHGIKQLSMITNTRIVCIQDPTEQHPLPPGSYRFRTAETRDNNTRTTQRARLSSHARQQVTTVLTAHRQAVISLCQDAGVELEWVPQPAAE